MKEDPRTAGGAAGERIGAVLRAAKAWCQAREAESHTLCIACMNLEEACRAMGWLKLKEQRR